MTGKVPEERLAVRIQLKPPLRGRFAPRTEFERLYLSDESLMHDNANIAPSASAMYVYNSLELLKKEFESFLMKYVPEALAAHKAKKIHIHKSPEILYAKYCQGIEGRVITKAGLCGNVRSGPPRHLQTAVEQIKRGIIYANYESVGAIGLNEVCLILAPYVKHDPEVRSSDERERFKKVHNAVQSFLFELNATERPSAQRPFTNTGHGIEYSPETLREYVLYYAGQQVGNAEEYLEEAMLIFSALTLEYLVGDADGRPFTFPIPSVVYTEYLDKRLAETELEIPPGINEKLERLLGFRLSERTTAWTVFWLMTAVRGYPYFLYKEYEKYARSFCCRLIIDFKKMAEAIHATRGVWTIPPIYGSLDYISIDLFDIVWTSRDDNEILEKLLYYMELARRALNALRAHLEKLYDEGFFPFTKWLTEAWGLVGVNPLRHFYYNTIAFPNLAEACNLYILKFVYDKPDDKLPPGSIQGYRTIWAVSPPDSSLKREVKKFYRKILEFANKVVEEFEKLDGVPYNIEQAPAEKLNYTLAQRRLEEYGKAVEPYIPREVDLKTGKVEYFFTSQLTPPYCLWPLEDQIEIEAEIQPYFTGGVIKLLFVFKPIANPYEKSKTRLEDSLEKLRELVSWIMDCGVRYLGITPTQNFCRRCGRMFISDSLVCPFCGSDEIEVWSRIVGYYRPVIIKQGSTIKSTWNPGKRAEFTVRLKYASKWLDSVRIV